MNIGTTMAKKYGVSPYAKGTTLNKLANMVVDKMRYSGKGFGEIFASDEMRRIIATHNQGEFRRYPAKGEGSFKALLMLAVGKKLGLTVK